MTRVVQVVPGLTPYGLEKMVVGLVRLLDRGRFQPSVISLFPEGTSTLEPELRALGVPVLNLGKRPGLDLRMYPRLVSALRTLRPHIMHTHNYVTRYTWPAARMARVPATVHTVHNVADREVGPADQRIQSFAFRHGVAAVTIADEVSASFRRVYGFAETALIPNGIPVEEFRAPRVARAQWRAAGGIPQDEFVYLCVARFSPQKDHATLLQAFHSGPARLARTRLVLAGDGDLRPAIEQQIAQLGLQQRVTLLGGRSDMPDVLGAADAFVLTSRWEGNPLSVMEAMAAGLPVVATTVGALPELVRSGVDGMLTRVGDFHALGDAMSLVAERPTLRAEMARSAAARAAERFSLTHMVASYSELYDRLMPSAGAGKAARTMAGVVR